MEHAIQTLPPGDMYCAKNGKYYKWYLHHKEKSVYLDKSQRKLAEALALKKYYKSRLFELKDELKLLSNYEKQHQKLNHSSKQLLAEDSPYLELLRPNFLSLDDYAENWLKEEYETNHSHPENLRLKTLKGEHVRSKSEVIIANALFTNQVPYKYECQLICQGGLYYPDFTILNVSERKLFYWEHFGLMDNAGYRKATYEKLETYARNNIIPSINLITTYETKENPLDSRRVQRLIEEYFD